MTTEQGEENRIAPLSANEYGMVALKRELVALAERIEAVELAVATSSSVYTAEDHELIKAHVRHPGALEAAKLKERIAAALVALSHVDGRHGDVAIAILGAP